MKLSRLVALALLLPLIIPGMNIGWVARVSVRAALADTARPCNG